MKPEDFEKMKQYDMRIEKLKKLRQWLLPIIVSALTSIVTVKVVDWLMG